MLAALRIRLFSSLLLASVLTGQPAHAQDASQLDDAYLAELRTEHDALRARIQQWPPALQAQNAQVSAALRAGNRQEAQRIAEDMARQEPANADIRLFLGKLHGQQGNMAAALALFEQSIALDPDNKWAYVNKAGAQAERADLPNALATTQTLTARFPGWSIGYNLQASMLDALNRPHEALDSFEKAVRAKPASALILTNLGNLQRRLGRVADARKSYEAALRLQPGYTLTETQLASLPQ